MRDLRRAQPVIVTGGIITHAPHHTHNARAQRAHNAHCAPDTHRAHLPTMSTNTRTSTASAARIAWGALLGCTGVVIGAGFALTFHGLYGYGRQLAHWGPMLAAFGPISCDGLTLVSIAATFLLAYVHAPWRPRAYAWFVFAVSCVASVAGNTAYALRPLPAWAGAIGAAMCPVFVTLAAHLGVVCWRHWQTPRPAAASPTEQAAALEPQTPTHVATTQAPTPAAATPRRVDRDDSDSTKLAQRVAVTRTSGQPAGPATIPAPLHLVPWAPEPAAPARPARVKGEPTALDKVRAAYLAGEQDTGVLHAKYAPTVHIGTVRRWVQDLRGTQPAATNGGRP